MSCPKCGCLTMIGPRYMKGYTPPRTCETNWSTSHEGEEHLAYSCQNCGYVEKKCTLEQLKNQSMGEAIEKLIGDKGG